MLVRELVCFILFETSVLSLPEGLSRREGLPPAVNVLIRLYMLVLSLPEGLSRYEGLPPAVNVLIRYICRVVFVYIASSPPFFRPKNQSSA